MAIETAHNPTSSGTVFVDSMSYIRRLEAKGYTQEQAEEQINVMLDIMNNSLASKQDLLALQHTISNVETRLQSKIEKLELRMVIKLGAVMLAGIAIIQYLNGSI